MRDVTNGLPRRCARVSLRVLVSGSSTRPLRCVTCPRSAYEQVGDSPFLWTGGQDARDGEKFVHKTCSDVSTDEGCADNAVALVRLLGEAFQDDDGEPDGVRCARAVDSDGTDIRRLKTLDADTLYVDVTTCMAMAHFGKHEHADNPSIHLHQVLCASPCPSVFLNTLTNLRVLTQAVCFAEKCHMHVL